MRHLTMLLAQLNWQVGAIESNTERMVQIVEQQLQPADLVLFSELALTGYPPQDLLFRPDLHDRCRIQLARLATASYRSAILLGHPWQANGRLFNALSLFWQGKLLIRYHKQLLNRDGIGDEDRYFFPGSKAGLVTFKGYTLGLLIGEDLWADTPINLLKLAGAELVISIHASPYNRQKPRIRRHLIQRHTRRTGLPLIYLNQVGGQDELIFDGQSQLYNALGEPVVRLASFEEQLAGVTLQEQQVIEAPAASPCYSPLAQIYGALVLALRDYVTKNGFQGTILGLSGGIDSALTLAIAVDALGKERVRAVMMPSHYTAAISLEGAQRQANLLGISLSVISIVPFVEAFMLHLTAYLQAPVDAIAQQNLQARCRGTLLMALANQWNHLVLNTGNKSETAVGYTTLYGDMVGGFAVLKDISKSLVYQLAHYRNRQAAAIPLHIMERPPSAELAPGQTDQQTLPPYAILDAIVQRYVEQDQSAADIMAAGFEETVVSQIIQLVDNSEHKRRQSAVGPRITLRSFGKDRRYPITCAFSPLASKLSQP